jgi:hypothetical protein
MPNLASVRRFTMTWVEKNRADLLQTQSHCESTETY